MVGLATRLAALPLLATMVVAIFTAKRAELTGVTELFGFIEWTYLVMLGWLALVGPGRFSFDRLLTRRGPLGAMTVGASRSLLDPRAGASIG